MARLPDEDLIKIYKRRLNKSDCLNKGYILDGFPRTTAQAEALDELMTDKGWAISGLVAMSVPENLLIDRLQERAKTSGRTDDADVNIIKNRIGVYRNQTEIVADHYAAQGKSVSIDGVGSIDEVYDRLCEQIEAMTNQ